MKGKSTLNVCMLAYTFYETDNRVMRYSETLAKRGDHVDVIALRRLGDEACEVIGGVHVYRVQKRVKKEKWRLSYLFRLAKFFFKSFWLLSRMHRCRPYHLIHVHTVPDFEVFAAAVPRLFGAKIILDIHDILPEFYASKFCRGRKGIQFKMLLLVEKVSAAFADHVIASNHIWGNRLKQRSVNREKCTTLINYPDTSIFFPRDRVRTGKDFVMLYHGTVNWHQGLDIAVRAMARIKDTAPCATLSIYGGGPHWDYLEKLVVQLGLNSRVFLKPSVPLRQIAEIVAQADLGIIPKRNDQFGGEAFSTKTLEFMSCGVPIVLSKTRIDQYYFDDSLVKFFEPENVDDLAAAITAMINDRPLRERLAANGREFAKQNRWEVRKEVYLNLVDKLVDAEKR